MENCFDFNGSRNEADETCETDSISEGCSFPKGMILLANKKAVLTPSQLVQERLWFSQLQQRKKPING